MVRYVPRPGTFEAANFAPVIPAVVVQVWGDGSLANLKGFTDGPDNIWLPSAKYDSTGQEPGSFHFLTA